MGVAVPKVDVERVRTASLSDADVGAVISDRVVVSVAFQVPQATGQRVISAMKHVLDIRGLSLSHLIHSPHSQCIISHDHQQP